MMCRTMAKLLPFLVLIVSIYNGEGANCKFETVDHIKSTNLKIERKIQMCDDVEVWGYGRVDVDKVPVPESVKEATIPSEFSTKHGINNNEAVGRANKILKKSTEPSCIKRININGDEPSLVYHCNALVKRSNVIDNTFITLNASTGDLLDQFSKLVTVCNSKEGGNDVVGKYEYGKLEWSGRSVQENKENCSLDSKFIQVRCQTDRGESWPPDNCFNDDPVQCDNCGECHSQINDAWFFTNSFIQILKDRFEDQTLTSWLKKKVPDGKIKICVNSNLMRKTAFFTEPANLFFARKGGTWEAMAVPSIIGHELGHVLIAATCRLKHQGQSGAIAESFADVCGILLKSSITDFEPDWLIGDEVEEPFIRRMDDPLDDGKSIGHLDDYNDDTDVTHASGIFNKAFSNLVTVNGWSLHKAFSLFLHAAKFYWKPLTGFSEGVCGLLSAARDLDYDEDDVSQAFAIVGVYCDCPEDGGWQSINAYRKQFCFQVVKDKVIWSEALRRCRMIGGQLACIQTDEKNMVLKEFLYNETSHLESETWVGGEDFRDENDWSWFPIDQDLRKYNWYNTLKGDDRISTDNTDTQNCMAFFVPRGRFFGWTPRRCDEDKFFVCELVT